MDKISTLDILFMERVLIFWFINTGFKGNFLHLVLRRGHFLPRSCFAHCVSLALVS